MCVDPMTAVGMVATGAGGGLQAAGSIMSGRGSARQARLQAWMAQQNAQNALQKGAFEQARLRDQVDTVLDNQTASVAARDIDPAYGSPLVMQGLSAMQGEADAMLIGAGAQQEAAEHMWTAAGKIGEARDARNAGYLGAGTAILGTISKWASLAGGGGSGARTTTVAGARLNPDVHKNPFGRY
jgi:hypothetical protein